jgi:uncharacterized protein (TIGR03084 family)
MNEIIAALADQQAELAELVDGLDDASWQRASPCEGWSVSDVVLHVAQTNEMAIASIEHRLPEFLAAMASGLRPASSIDDGAEAMVAKERGPTGADIRSRWQASVGALHKLFTAADPHERVTWVAGQLSVQTLATTRLAETWIHTGDVAQGLGRVLQPTERLRHIARLAWRTLPYAFARAGRTLQGDVAFELRGPRGDPWHFTPEGSAITTIRGDGTELCLVAGRRRAPADTSLRGEGPDADAVLELVRTYA